MQPEEKFPPMLNTQRFTLIEIILLCKKMDRILVLPPILSQPRNNTIAESGETDHHKFVLGEIFIPMEEIFNIEILRKYINVIKFSEFIKISRGNISTLCCLGKPHSRKIKSYAQEFHCKKILNTKKFEDIVNLDEPFVAITGYEPGKYLIKSFPTWPREFRKDYWEITRHLQYNKRLIHKADNFIRKNGLKSYVAVHWRRGDRAHPEVSELAEQVVHERTEMKKRLDSFLIHPILKIMKKYQLEKVFLATNSGTKWHLEYLRSRLPLVQYPPSGKLENREEESIIEQIICIKSDYFFAAPFHYDQCSNFSRWIIDLRILTGKKRRNSHQLKMHSSMLFARISLLKNKFLSIIKSFAKNISPSLTSKLQNSLGPIHAWLKLKF